MRRKRFITKFISFILTILIITQTLTYSTQTQYNSNDSLALSSIFTDDRDAVEVVMSETVGDLVDLYYKKQINDADIYQLLSFYQDIAQKTGKQEVFLKMQAGLMFRLHYPKLGIIKDLKVEKAGLSNSKPVTITTNIGKYVFKAINESFGSIDERYSSVWKQQPSIFYVDFVKWLTDKKIPGARFIDNKIVRIGKTDYVCMEFKEGFTSYPLKQPYNRGLGEIAARINNAQKGFAEAHPEYLTDPELGDEDRIQRMIIWQPLEEQAVYKELPEGVQKDEQKRRMWWEKYQQTIELRQEQCRLFLQNYKTLNRSKFQKAFIHADVFAPNVKFDEKTGKARGIFDFDVAHYNYRIAEFMNLMLAYNMDNPTKFIDILIAYQSNVDEPLNEEEIRGIIELTRFKHIITPSIWYSTALEKFAADFSTEEQISTFVQKLSFTNIHTELTDLGLSPKNSMFSEIARDVFALYKKNDGSIRNPQDKKKFLQNIVYAVIIKYKQKLAPKIIKNLLQKILLRFMPSVNPSFSEKVLSYMERFSETMIHDYGIGVAKVNVNSDNEYLEILMYCAIAPLLENEKDKEKFVIDILKNREFKNILLNREGTEFIDPEIKEKVMKLFFGSGIEKNYRLTSNSLFAALEVTIERGKRLKNVLEDILVRGRRFPHTGELSLTYDESITEIFYDREVENQLLNLGFKQETELDKYAFARTKRIVMQGLKKEAKFPFVSNTQVRITREGRNVDLDLQAFILEKFREAGFLRRETIDFENIVQTPEFRDMDEFFHDMRSSEQFNSDEPGNFLEKMKTFLESETGTEIARGQEAYTGPANLDGKTIIFPVRNFEQGGGVVTYIEAQMAYLLARNNVTIHLLCAAKDVREITKIKFGKGTIVFHPIPSVDYAIHMGLEIDKIEKETGVDLILTHEYTLESYAAMYYANKKGIPSLDICHLGQCSIRHRQYHSIFWQSRVFYLASMLGVVSDAALKYSEFLSPDKRRINFGPMLNLGVFGNELDILDRQKISELRRTLKLGERGNPNVFLLPSRIAVNKGPLMMLQACNLVFKTKGRNDFLIILTCSAPDERYLKEVMQYIKDNGLQDNVLFLGAKDGDILLLNLSDFNNLLEKGGSLDAISQEDLKYFYAVSSVVALPTLVESFPLVPLEAQLMNKSVIVGLTDGTPETFIAEESHPGEGTGFGMKIEDLRDAFDGFVSRDEIVSRLAAILEKMFPDDPTKAEQMKKYREIMGKKGRDFVISQFSPSAMIARIENAFVELLGVKDLLTRIRSDVSRILTATVEESRIERLAVFVRDIIMSFLRIETGLREDFNIKTIEPLLSAV